MNIGSNNIYARQSSASKLRHDKNQSVFVNVFYSTDLHGEIYPGEDCVLLKLDKSMSLVKRFEVKQ